MHAIQAIKDNRFFMNVLDVMKMILREMVLPGVVVCFYHNSIKLQIDFSPFYGCVAGPFPVELHSLLRCRAHQAPGLAATLQQRTRSRFSFLTPHYAEILNGSTEPSAIPLIRHTARPTVNSARTPRNRFGEVKRQ
jgi:hypothetical protein